MLPPIFGPLTVVFMSSRRATLHDVARAAGVSTTTASDALAGRGRVADRTRAHILEVASGLGYVASAVARGLRSGTAGVIGLFIPEETVGLDYYLQLMQGAAEAAIGEGLAITLVPPGIRREQMAALALDGLIVSDPSLTDPVMETVRGLPVPHVTLERDLAPDATAWRHCSPIWPTRGRVGSRRWFPRRPPPSVPTCIVSSPNPTTTFACAT